jgi:hypothetical protein
VKLGYPVDMSLQCGGTAEVGYSSPPSCDARSVEVDVEADVAEVGRFQPRLLSTRVVVVFAVEEDELGWAT